LIFCTLANICGAQVLDAAALARALKCGLDFKTGVKPVCTLLEFADGKTWLITFLVPALSFAGEKRALLIWTNGQEWSVGRLIKEITQSL
jgi:hypothetical protein